MQCDCNAFGTDICPSCGRHNTNGSSRFVQQEYEHTGPAKGPECLPELANVELTQSTKLEITKLFQSLTDNKTTRKSPRRSIIYVCMEIVCKKKNIPFDGKEMKRTFGITESDVNSAKKKLGRALNAYDLDPQYNTEVTMNVILKTLMTKFDIRESYLAQIMSYYYLCQNTSVLLRRSKIESCAAGLLYYFMSESIEGFDKNDYFLKAGVSSATCIDIALEIKTIVEHSIAKNTD